MTDQAFLAEFMAGNLAPEGFNHQGHLRAARLLLATMPFLEACIAMRDGLRCIAGKAGKSDLYHETVTVAFMAIMAEQMASADSGTDACPAQRDLSDRDLLASYYSPARLASARARRMFMLPDRVQHTATNVATGHT